MVASRSDVIVGRMQDDLTRAAPCCLSNRTAPPCPRCAREGRTVDQAACDPKVTTNSVSRAIAIHSSTGIVGTVLSTPPKLMDERMGHEDGSVRSRYTHITPAMRKQLLTGLTECWKDALERRRQLSPTSPVAALQRPLHPDEHQ
jgi:hypothetical protein